MHTLPQTFLSNDAKYSRNNSFTQINVTDSWKLTNLSKVIDTLILAKLKCVKVLILNVASIHNHQQHHHKNTYKYHQVLVQDLLIPELG